MLKGLWEKEGGGGCEEGVAALPQFSMQVSQLGVLGRQFPLEEGCGLLQGVLQLLPPGSLPLPILPHLSHRLDQLRCSQKRPTQR